MRKATWGFGAGAILSALVGLLAVTPAPVRADSGSLGPISLNVGKNLNDHADSPSFKVTATGQIVVGVSAHTNGFLPNDPNVKVRLELLKPNGQRAGQPVEKLINNAPVGMSLSYKVTADDLHLQPQLWKVRLTNIDPSNRRDFSATVNVAFPSSTVTLAVSPNVPLTLFAGQEESKTFSTPSGKTGTLEISAEWNTDLFGVGLLNPKPLQLTLRKPNGQVAKSGSQMSPMVMTYQVKASDIQSGNTWTINVLDPNAEGLEHIKVKVRFTPSN
jgi:hypothetical protein